MKMKNKLIDLLLDCDKAHEVLDCFNDRSTKKQTAGIIADFLLANGIIVPPCKVGDTVWFNTYKNSATVCVGIQPHTVDCIDVNMICDTSALVPTRLPYSEFGTSVFLTKEEAERHLEESR
jgi:hypothetical protein